MHLALSRSRDGRPILWYKNGFRSFRLDRILVRNPVQRSDSMAISVTSIFCAFLRGFHFENVDNPVFDDSYGLRLIPEDRLSMIKEGFIQALPFPVSREDPLEIDAAISKTIQGMPTTAQVLSRARYTEQRVERFISERGRQYLILGAGLDSFSLRHSQEESLVVYEIDEKDTQEFKIEQVLRVNRVLPSNTEYLPADLSKSPLEEIVKGASFDGKGKSCISALGLLMYLTKENIESLFHSFAEICSPGSMVVFDYFDEDTFDRAKSSSAFQRMLEQSRFTGEEFRSLFSLDELRTLCDNVAFSIEEHLSPDDIDAAYFADRADDYHACEHVHFMSIVKE